MANRQPTSAIGGIQPPPEEAYSDEYSYSESYSYSYSESNTGQLSHRLSSPSAARAAIPAAAASVAVAAAAASEPVAAASVAIAAAAASVAASVRLYVVGRTEAGGRRLVHQQKCGEDQVRGDLELGHVAG